MEEIEHKNEKTFLKEWGLTIGFAVGAVALIVGFRLWSEYQADQPILPVYARYLGYLAEGSQKASANRDRYYSALGRTTIASQHFLGVCKMMQKSAIADGVNPSAYSVEMAQGCASDAMSESILDQLPQVEIPTAQVK